MTLFIIVCALLTAAAITLLVWPLLRTSADAEGAPQRANIAATIVAAGFPLVAFAIYVWASEWPWDAAQQVAHPSTAPDIQQMVTQLQQRLSQQPDDIEGWKLLGRSATVLGDYPAARDAFSQAYTRSQGQDPDAVVGYAESLLLNDEREIDGQAAELFEKAVTHGAGQCASALVWRHRRLSARRIGARPAALGGIAESGPAAGSAANGRRAAVGAREAAECTAAEFTAGDRRRRIGEHFDPAGARARCQGAA